MSLAFGSGPSNGQFWFGGSTFPGFMFKKNVGVGGRRSTKMNPGGNITCNSPAYLYNKYTPGASGVGASSMSNRRAKNRLATVCKSGLNNCFPCQSTLGQYSKYTHNPNGFIPCLPNPNPCSKKIITVPDGFVFTTNTQLEGLRGCTAIIGSIKINTFVGQPDFSVFDCLKIISGDLNIFNNNDLTSISGFNNLTTVNNTFIIGLNNALTSISGFNNLIRIGSFFICVG